MLLPLSQAGPVAAAAAAVVEDIVRRCGTKFQVPAVSHARFASPDRWQPCQWSQAL